MGGVWAGVAHTTKSHFGKEFLLGMEHSTPHTPTSIKGMDKYGGAALKSREKI